MSTFSKQCVEANMNKVMIKILLGSVVTQTNPIQSLL